MAVRCQDDWRAAVQVVCAGDRRRGFVRGAKRYAAATLAEGGLSLTGPAILRASRIRRVA